MKTSRSVALEYQTYNPSCPEQDQKKQMPLAQTTLIRQVFLKKVKTNNPPPQISTIHQGENALFQSSQFSNPDSSTPPFPLIKSKMVAKHMTKERWIKLSHLSTRTVGWTLAKAMNCYKEFVTMNL